MTPYWTSPDGRHVIYLGDSLEILPTLEAGSVSLVCTDPPYHGVKDDAWDNQWDTDAAFLAWVSQVCGLFDGVLAPNGSLYWFASPQMADLVSVEIRKTFNVLNAITWDKGRAAYSLTYGAETFRRYVPSSERIVFAERYNSDNVAKGEASYVGKCDELRGFVFEPVMRYIVAEFASAGLSRAEVDAHFKTANVSQYWLQPRGFIIPTADRWEGLRAIRPTHFRREYEDLRLEYEDLRREYEDLRRPFSVTARDEWCDVWRFAIERDQVHPTQKPLGMMAHIVKTSSREDGLVCDPFMGSGTTGVACIKLGRKFIGIEMEPKYCDIAVKRMERELSQPHLPGMEPEKAVQETMFDRISGATVIPTDRNRDAIHSPLGG